MMAARLVSALACAAAMACTSPLSRSVAPGAGGTSGGSGGSGWRGGGTVYQPGVGFVSAARLNALKAAVRSNDPAVSWSTLHGVCEQVVDSSPHPDARYVPGQSYSSSGPITNPGDAQVRSDFGHDAQRAYGEALCFRLSPDSARARAYASAAERFITAWVTQGFSDVSDDPQVNLAFAQGFIPMTVAADLLATDASWDPRPYRSYLLNVVLAHNAPNKAMNNLGAWDLGLRTIIGAYLDNGAMVDSMRQRWLFLADTQVAPDGSLRFEICRSNTDNWCGDPNKGINGLAYSNFDLAPLAIAAEVFAHRGVSVWETPEADNFGRAYATIAQWTLAPETSPYYGHNGGQLTASQPPDFYIIFQRHFPSSSGAAVYAQNVAKAWAVPYWAEVIYGVNVAD